MPYPPTMVPTTSSIFYAPAPPTIYHLPQNASHQQPQQQQQQMYNQYNKHQYNPYCDYWGHLWDKLQNDFRMGAMAQRITKPSLERRATIRDTPTTYEIVVDITEYDPNEINVHVSNGVIVVKGIHGAQPRPGSPEVSSPSPPPTPEKKQKKQPKRSSSPTPSKSGSPPEKGSITGSSGEAKSPDDEVAEGGEQQQQKPDKQSELRSFTESYTLPPMVDRDSIQWAFRANWLIITGIKHLPKSPMGPPDRPTPKFTYLRPINRSQSSTQ